MFSRCCLLGLVHCVSARCGLGGLAAGTLSPRCDRVPGGGSCPTWSSAVLSRCSCRKACRFHWRWGTLTKEKKVVMKHSCLGSVTFSFSSFPSQNSVSHCVSETFAYMTAKPPYKLSHSTPGEALPQPTAFLKANQSLTLVMKFYLGHCSELATSPLAWGKCSFATMLCLSCKLQQFTCQTPIDGCFNTCKHKNITQGLKVRLRLRVCLPFVLNL